MFKLFRPAAAKADSLIDQVYRHLVNAAETAGLAVEHAAKAVATHEAAIVFHHEKQAAAAVLHAEASTALSDVKNLLGQDVVPAVEHAAEQAAADVAAHAAEQMQELAIECEQAISLLAVVDPTAEVPSWLLEAAQVGEATHV